MSPGKSQYKPGETIPGTVYRVHRVVGAGGMGTVYDVEDTTVGKRYVLKALHANLSDRDDLGQRLLREARALARMHHPTIVEVFTAGVTTDRLRLPYFVMERLNGYSLRQVLNRVRRLSLDQAVDIGIDLLDALDHAHGLGMIHRDVKPDNLFLHRGVDGVAVAKLLDFGIAKVVATSLQLTGGRFIGTFRYASPEQIVGKAVTPQSDLYAAGLTLFEMLAGRGPFDECVAEIDIGRAHASVPAPRVSQFVAVPRALDDLIASALDKRPEARPKDALAFATILRELKRAARQGRRAPATSRPVAPEATVASVPFARPAEVGQVFTPLAAVHGAPDLRDTRLESPQSRLAATAAGGARSGTNPYGPQVLDTRADPRGPAPRGAAHTIEDGAPGPMTLVPAPSDGPPQVVHRGAEPHTAVPSVPPSAVPIGDTQPMPLVRSVRPLSTPDARPAVAQSAPAPPVAGGSTFAAPATDTPPGRSGRVRTIAYAALAFVAVASIGIAAGALLKHGGAPAPTPAPTRTGTPPGAASAAGEPSPVGT